jgi:ubiquinone/menaquinone biosynthesis C-methylase UbiE
MYPTSYFKNIQHFYDSIAEIYDELIQDRWDEIYSYGCEKWLKILFGKFQNISKVLDCGCGTGINIIGLSNLGYEVCGCDLSKKMLKKAQENISKYSFKTEPKLINCNMLELPKYFEKEEFDAVICSGNILVHLPHPALLSLFLRKVAYVLKRNGIFVLEFDSNFGNFKKALERKEILFHTENTKPHPYLISFHIWPFTSKKLVQSIVVIINKRRQYNSWDIKYFQIPLRTIFFNELNNLLKNAGFANVSVVPLQKIDGKYNRHTIWFDANGKIRREKNFVVIAKKR